MQKVVILGGGFAGLVTARHLVKAGVVGQLCEVTVIDVNDAHVYTPWRYEAATGALRGETEATKVRMLNTAAFVYSRLPGFKAVRFVCKRIESVDFATKHILVEGQRQIPYDVLVVALGAEPNYYAVPGLPEHALVLKQLADAHRLHDAIVRLFDQVTPHTSKYIVIVGAGPNGLEFVSELANTLRVLERDRRIPANSIKITLIDPSQTLFTILPLDLRQRAIRRLESLGIELRPGLRVSEVGRGFVRAFTTSGKSDDMLRLPADLCVWSAGVRAHSLVSSWPFAKDERGRIVLEPTYQVVGQAHVFAGGDCAALLNPHTGKADPQSAQVAHYQAHGLAQNLVRYLQGRSLKTARLPKRWAFLTALGGTTAAGTLGGVNLWGYPAFVLRRLSDLYYFMFLLPPVAAVQVWLKGVRLYHKNDR